MKKLLVGLLSLVLILGLAGCGSDNGGSSDGDGAGETVFTEQLLTDGKLIVGTSPDYPPFESLNTSGEIEGFDIDMINEVVAIINANHGTSIEVELKQMDFDTIVSALQAKQIDVGLSGFTYSADRDVIFSTPYLLSKQVVVVRADSGIETLTDLEGKNIAAGLGTTGDEEAKKIVGATVTNPGDYQMMFIALEAGQIDAVVCDEAVADNFVREKGFVKLAETLVDEDMSVIIENGNGLLAEIINEAITEFINSDKYAELKTKWQLGE